jgi:hypothetical protein
MEGSQSGSMVVDNSKINVRNLFRTRNSDIFAGVLLDRYWLVVFDDLFELADLILSGYDTHLLQVSPVVHHFEDDLLLALSGFAIQLLHAFRDEL